ncbi:MAG TPA: 2'-5' RNA ligase family protein [Rhodanobacter sp.]|nr:2'-5' RNA ligase family protein [Rhodanobacter sp.]
MSQQASFPGFAQAVATDRLFLATFPDRDTADRLAALAAAQCARHDLRGKPLATDRFHVTLFHLDDSVGLRPELVEAAGAAAARVVVAPFDVVFDQVTSFDAHREKSPFVLTAEHGNAPLHAFQAELGVRLREAGLGRCVASGFKPHVTLAYDRRVIAPEKVAPIAWRVEEFVLVHSLLGQTRHIPLAHWPLK